MCTGEPPGAEGEGHRARSQGSRAGSRVTDQHQWVGMLPPNVDVHQVKHSGGGGGVVVLESPLFT